MRVRLLPDVVAEQAEMFLINGDMQSNLYTSSRAMHSAILGLLQVPPVTHFSTLQTGTLIASCHSLLPDVQTRRWMYVGPDLQTVYALVYMVASVSQACRARLEVV